MVTFSQWEAGPPPNLAEWQAASAEIDARCALVAWVIIATALGHPFWTMEGAARAANQANFYKNLAIMAAYLLLAITGAGRYSLDHRPASAPTKAAAVSA